MNADLEKQIETIPSKWRWHYDALTKLRERLCQTRQRSLHEATEAVGWHDSDPADMAFDETDRDLALTLLSTEMDSLYEIEAAISRIEEGTYGICEMTGAPIPAERLRAVPWTRFCKAAAENLEDDGFPNVVPFHPMFWN